MLFFLGPDENNRLIVCSLPIRLTSRGLRNFEFTELVVTASAEAASHLFRLLGCWIMSPESFSI